MLDPTPARDWAHTIALLVSVIETRVIKAITDQVRAGRGAYTYDVDKLAQLASLRARVLEELGEPWEHVIQEAQAVLDMAADAGQGAARGDLAAWHNTNPPHAVITLQAAQGLAQIAADTLMHMTSLPALILRDALDAYQAIMAIPVSEVALGAATRVQATEDALQQFAAHGFDSFTDKSGRKWRIDSYAEMATRTGAINAMRYGYIQTLTQSGLDLVMVSGQGYTCPKCAPWEGKVLSLTGLTPVGMNMLPSTVDDSLVPVMVHGTYDQARAEGLFHPNCFPGSVLVEAPTGVNASYSRWYEGDVIVVETASGNQLTVTPNHPVLTAEGWVAAGSLREGMNVVRHNRWGHAGLVNAPNDEHVPARIGDVHRALKESLTVATVSVPAASHQFHGDGTRKGDVEVVLPHGLLKGRALAKLGEELRDLAFLVCGVGLRTLLPERARFEVIVRSLHAAHGLVSGPGIGKPLLACHTSLGSASGLGDIGSVTGSKEESGNRGLGASEALADLLLGDSLKVKANDLGTEGFAFRPVVTFDSKRCESPGYHPIVNAIEGRKLLDRLSGEVTLSKIVKVDKVSFAGHVYNLETKDHWYLADSIVVHNCGHSIAAYLPGASRRAPTTGGDPATYKASQRQRALERAIRKEKRGLAASLTPETATEHRRRIRQRQAEIRSLLDKHPQLQRKPVREQIKTAH